MSRILLISNLYPPLMRGGAERIAAMEAEALVRGGHEVHVLTTSPCSSLSLSGGAGSPAEPDRASRDGSAGRGGIIPVEHTIQNGVHIHRYVPALPYHILQDTHQSLWKRLWWHAKDLWPTTSARVARQILEEVKLNRILFHNMRGMGLGVWRTCLRSGIPVEQVWHDVGGIVPSGLWWLARHRPLWQWAPVRHAYARWLQWWGGRAPRMRFPSEALREVYACHGWMDWRTQVIVQPNTVVSSQGAPAIVSDACRRAVDETKAQRSRGQFVIGFVGQITESKGADLILQAVARQKVPTTLWMVGDGPQRAELEAWAQANVPTHITVRWFGQVSRAEVDLLLSGMSVLCVPSLVWENCPGVVLEAQKVGLCVLGSDTGGLRELLPPECRVKVGDVEAWAEVLTHWE